jgi:hypothetical protein
MFSKCITSIKKQNAEESKKPPKLTSPKKQQIEQKEHKQNIPESKLCPENEDAESSSEIKGKREVSEEEKIGLKRKAYEENGMFNCSYSKMLPSVMHIAEIYVQMFETV